MKILVLNAGSSSLKSSVFEIQGDALPSAPPVPCWEGYLEWDKSGHAGRQKITANGVSVETSVNDVSYRQALAGMLDTLWKGELAVLPDVSGLAAVGHRVVHGGDRYSEPARINPTVKADIVRFSALAPLHNPVQLEGIELIQEYAADIPQTAVFDTAFHHHIPLHASTIAIPHEWRKRGIRRYGFHGISHKDCAERAARLTAIPLEKLRLITCHLGNGVSLAAIRGGYSIDTTMGFSPLEGLMMGTRSGSMDPAILIHLMKIHSMDAEQLSEMLNGQSGLKGISGIGPDMRAIHAAILEGNERAQLALDMFIYRLRLAIGEMLAALGGVDTLVFTAGIGENDPVVRARVCEGFEFAGLELDQEKNSTSLPGQDIASKRSSISVFILPAQENWAIAKACRLSSIYQNNWNF